MIPIKNPDALWNHTEFNSNNPLVIFVTGWKTNLKQGISEAQDVMADAYLCRGNVNFVVIIFPIFFIFRGKKQFTDRNIFLF